MPLLIVLLGIALLLIMIIFLRINAFVALILVAIGVGLAQGMPAMEVIKSIQSGVGSTLGYLALILGLGAMLGALIAESGAAQLITTKLIGWFGLKNMQWAVMLTGFIVGVPMFYSVGFVMLIPLIFAVARRTGLPLLYVGIPMVAALSVTHGFLPPHPAPTAIVAIYGADIGLTLLYGLILAVPTIIIAGPLFGKLFRNAENKAPAALFESPDLPEDQLPGLGISIFTALFPVLLMAIAAIAKLSLPEDNFLLGVLSFLGDPVIALLLAVLLAVLTLGLRNGRNMNMVMDYMVEGVKSIAIILLIIGAGGAFKQVLVDSGTSDYVVKILSGTQLSPLVLAWIIAAALRISLGSATVAALTAAGIATPLIGATNVSPELLVLATGAGSLTCSNVNDTGFWLFKEYFGLTIWETFKSWTVMETIVSIIGLVGCLLLEQFI